MAPNGLHFQGQRTNQAPPGVRVPLLGTDHRRTYPWQNIYINLPRSTQPILIVPASAGVTAGMSPLLGGR